MTSNKLLLTHSQKGHGTDMINIVEMQIFKMQIFREEFFSSSNFRQFLYFEPR